MKNVKIREATDRDMELLYNGTRYHCLYCSYDEERTTHKKKCPSCGRKFRKYVEWVAS